MARPASKIMSLVEKKQALGGLKQALKDHNENIKAIAAPVKDAAAALSKAKKEADAMITKLNKEQAVVAKQAEKMVKDAQKVYDAAAAKHEKANVAAAKGTDKLTSQIAELEAAPVSDAKPVKASKKETAAA